MTRVEKITLIFTILSFVLVFLLGSQGLILTPLFTIDVKQPSDTNVEINNIGMAQAKNAIIHIITEKPLNMTNTVCLEQSKINSDDEQIIIHLDRFSTGITCNLSFDGKVQFALKHIVVSADGSRGLEWNPLDDMNNKFLSLMISLYGTIAAIIAAIIGSTLSTYLRKQKKNTLKKFKTRDEEIAEEIKDAEEEMNTLQRTLSTTHPKAYASISQRISSLDEKIRNLSNESDSLKSSISLDGEFQEKVGKFFISWAEMEQQINRIALTVDIDPIRASPNHLIRQLHGKEIVSKELAKKFNEVAKFRNGVVHGHITPQSSELTLGIDTVKELMVEFQNILSERNQS